MPKLQRPYVKLNEDYIQSQTRSLSAQITDLENRLTAVRATTHDVGSDTATLDTVTQGTAPVDTAIQLMKLIRERKQYLNEFRVTRHGFIKRATAPDGPRRQYRRTYSPVPRLTDSSPVFRSSKRPQSNIH